MSLLTIWRQAHCGHGGQPGPIKPEISEWSNTWRWGSFRSRPEVVHGPPGGSRPAATYGPVMPSAVPNALLSDVIGRVYDCAIDPNGWEDALSHVYPLV